MGPHQSLGKGLKGRRCASDTFGKQSFDTGGVVGATSREDCALFSGQTSMKNFGTHQWGKHISITGRWKFFSASSNLSIVENFFRCPCVLRKRGFYRDFCYFSHKFRKFKWKNSKRIEAEKLFWAFGAHLSGIDHSYMFCASCVSISVFLAL